MQKITPNNIQPCIFRVLFPHGNYVINENTGEQIVPMVDMGLIKINDGSEPSFDAWARTAKPQHFPNIYFANKDAGVVKNFREFEKTTFRAKKQPDLIAFKEETLEVWEAA